MTPLFVQPTGGDPTLAAAGRLYALAAINDPDTPAATRRAAALFLWQHDPSAARRFHSRLRRARHSATPHQRALDHLEWLARRSCCDLHDHMIRRAAETVVARTHDAAQQ